MRDLLSSLAGQPPTNCNWTKVVTLANQALVTPQLAAAMQGLAEAPGPEMAAFLTDVRARNRERNRRLWQQLLDATAALAEAGIVPMLLKGAAQWVTLAPGSPFDRMLSDLDLLIRPDEVDPAIAALRRAGFIIYSRAVGPTVHVVAELGRAGDVGFIDLHQRPPGPPGLCQSEALTARSRRTTVGNATVAVPDPTSQLLLLLLHDRFHDGGYWRGGFDLRHLLDFGVLSPQLTVDDWAWLTEACGNRLVRSALAAESMAVQKLLGIDGCTPLTSHIAAWTYWRWLAQYACPPLRVPMAAMAVLFAAIPLWDHRRMDRRARAALFGSSSNRPSAIHLARLLQILQVKSGKI